MSDRDHGKFTPCAPPPDSIQVPGEKFTEHILDETDKDPSHHSYGTSHRLTQASRKNTEEA